MTNNLRKIKQDLCAFAKRCKDVHYSESLLITFLMSGMLFARNNLFAAPSDPIEAQKSEITSSIQGIRQEFKKARSENNKLLRATNLELTQLMEQGDHATKSPWSSWQFGGNYFYNNWNGTYKGRGDKKEKYPYEGVLKRDTNEFNRYVAPESSMYSRLPLSTDPQSASSNARQGLTNYGLASNTTVPEPPVSFQITASIKPRIVNKSAINVPAPEALTPTLPEAIDFNPVTPPINIPAIEAPVLTKITAPATGNGPEKYIRKSDSFTSVFEGNTSGNGDVAGVAVNSMEGTKNIQIVENGITKTVQTGTIDVTVGGTGSSGLGTQNNKWDLKTSNVKFTATDPNPSSVNNFIYSTDINQTGYNAYAFAKMIAGETVTVDNLTINFKGTGHANYSNWLFHTDGHNDRGESTWVLNSRTNVNIDGDHLVLYTSQYHQSPQGNTGFVNDGTITTSGSKNIGWIALDERHGVPSRAVQQYFHNRAGTINLGGTGDILAYIMQPADHVNSGFSYMNNGTINMTGSTQYGIIVNGGTKYPGGYDYNSAEIVLTNPLKISGTNSTGVIFKKWMNLEGGVAFDRDKGTNRITDLPSFTRASLIKTDLAGNKNTGIYFDSDEATNVFSLNNYELNIQKMTIDNKDVYGTNNTAIFVKDGKVALGTGTVNEINITKGSNNTAIYTESDDQLTTAATITINDSDNSSGIIANKVTGAVTVVNSGNIKATGKAVKAIIAKNSTVTSTGKVVVDGTALSDANGTVGLVSVDGGTLSQTHAGTDITVAGSASIGAYANGQTNSKKSSVSTTLNMTGGKITAKEGAFNLYSAKDGNIDLSGVTLETGQKSLTFYTKENGKINFSGNVTVNVAGGTDSNSRGTAFLYNGPGTTYAAFNKAAISTWVANTFNSTTNKLTLNMAPGSRLFIAQNVEMSLSDTSGSDLVAGLGTAPVGSDYKTFMLYLSKLKLDKNINLDDPTDAYNRLEISNSTIENNNTKTITGTQAGQVAMAQKNANNIAREKVTLTNNGTISLTGSKTTGMYARFGELVNSGTGIMTVGDSSAALYAQDSSKITNDGTINLGNGSTGIYSEGDTAAGIGSKIGSVTNDGTIRSAGKAIGITYNGVGSGGTDNRINNGPSGKINLDGEGSVGIYALGGNYEIWNKGEITLGNSSSLTARPNAGIYTPVETVTVNNDTGSKIAVGNNSVGVYGFNIDNAGTITAGDNGIAIYSKKLSSGSSTVNHSGTITVRNEDATGIFLENGGNLTFNSGAINVGDKSYGIVALGNSPFNYTNNSAATVTLGNGSTYFYSTNPTTNFTNNIALNSSGTQIYGISSPGNVVNVANFTLGDQSVGILNTGSGTAINRANIVVGNSDTTNKNYAIGMATQSGTIINDTSGSITVGNDGIGLFAEGANSRAINKGTINLNGTNAMGIYLDNGAKGENSGTITTGAGTGPDGAVGVVVQHGAELTNTGTIKIHSKEGYAFFKGTGGIIKNYGTIDLGNGASENFDPTSKPTTKTTAGVTINAPAGATPQTVNVTIDGVVQPIVHLTINTPEGKAGPSPTSLGIYVDTLGGTNPIQGNLGIVTEEADLIFGNEAARKTTSKNIIVSGKVLDPYRQMMAANAGITWNTYAGSLTWQATPLYENGQLGSVVLAKLPYTKFAGNEQTPVNSTDTYNFLDGLEQRYGVEALGTSEKMLFDRINEIGKNEKVLFFQATDEMMGHQYGNTQHRIYETGNLLDKEFTYLRKDWRTPSKQNNKIKTFGIRNEYNTDTAGIIDYRSNAYGVAYVHEDEKIKMGNSAGWYAGVVTNRFKFKDIGKSKEDQTILKAGIFKTMSPASDHNGALQWTIGGDVFAGINHMRRRFLIVDQVFQAKGNYHSYGAAFKTDLGYDLRLSERVHLRPYGALKMEYGRFNDIKESSGDIRLEVNGNDYFSFKPEVGVEFKYVQPLAVRTNLSVGLTAAYENELGKIENVKNQGRVRYTNADWFGIRSEKEDKRGNGKFDLNIGVDNTRFGVTVNAGYDTKGNNVRGGIGFRAIY